MVDRGNKKKNTTTTANNNNNTSNTSNTSNNIQYTHYIVLDIPKPRFFSYKAGQYVQIMIESQSKSWHPFTISSSPIDTLSIKLTIKVVGKWTKKLYKMILQRQYDINKITMVAREYYTRKSVKGISRDANQQLVSELEELLFQNISTNQIQWDNTSENNNELPKEEWIDMGDTWISVNGPLGTPTTIVQSILKNHLVCNNMVLVAGGIGITPFISALEYTAHNLRLIPTKSIDENYYIRKNMFLHNLVNHQKQVQRILRSSLRYSNKFRNRLSSILQSVQDFTSRLRNNDTTNEQLYNTKNDTKVSAMFKSIEDTTIFCLGSPMEIVGQQVQPILSSSLRESVGGSTSTITQFLQPFNPSLNTTKIQLAELQRQSMDKTLETILNDAKSKNNILKSSTYLFNNIDSNTTTIDTVSNNNIPITATAMVNNNSKIHTKMPCGIYGISPPSYSSQYTTTATTISIQSHLSRGDMTKNTNKLLQSIKDIDNEYDKIIQKEVPCNDINKEFQLYKSIDNTKNLPIRSSINSTTSSNNSITTIISNDSNNTKKIIYNKNTTNKKRLYNTNSNITSSTCTSYTCCNTNKSENIDTTHGKKLIDPATQVLSQLLPYFFPQHHPISRNASRQPLPISLPYSPFPCIVHIDLVWIIQSFHHLRLFHHLINQLLVASDISQDPHYTCQLPLADQQEYWNSMYNNNNNNSRCTHNKNIQNTQSTTTIPPYFIPNGIEQYLVAKYLSPFIQKFDFRITVFITCPLLEKIAQNPIYYLSIAEHERVGYFNIIDDNNNKIISKKKNITPTSSLEIDISINDDEKNFSQSSTNLAAFPFLDPASCLLLHAQYLCKKNHQDKDLLQNIYFNDKENKSIYGTWFITFGYPNNNFFKILSLPTQHHIETELERNQKRKKIQHDLIRSLISIGTQNKNDIIGDTSNEKYNNINNDSSSTRTSQYWFPKNIQSSIINNKSINENDLEGIFDNDENIINHPPYTVGTFCCCPPGLQKFIEKQLEYRKYSPHLSLVYDAEHF